MNESFDPNETAEARRVRALLLEASRYQPETPAPQGLVSSAFHQRSADCTRSALLPRLALPLGGFALVLAVAFWLRAHPPLPASKQLPQQAAVAPTESVRESHHQPFRKTPVTALPHSDVPAPKASYAVRPPNSVQPSTSQGMQANETSAHRPQIGFPRLHRPAVAVRKSLSAHAQQSASVAASVWKTEIVERAIVTQSLTPVLVAQPDTQNACYFLRPALLRLALLPDDSDSDAESPPFLSTTLIPVRIELEEQRP